MKKSLLFTLGFLLLLSFFTTNAQIVDYLFPVNELYGTGYWNTNGKVDGDIDLTYPTVAWSVFDLSILPAGTVIQSIKFYGYIDSTNFPQWSSTPMGIVNPLVDPGPDIYNQIITSYGQNMAYIHVDEWSDFNFGWHIYDLGNDAVPDLQAAVNSSQGWFAIGFIVRNFSPGNYLIFGGHTSPNVPWLRVTYTLVPVELTSFKADVQRNNVTLSWQTATETNNNGFEIERQAGSPHSAFGNWEKIGFVAGNGTSTQMHSYSFMDENVIPGKYYYRLKQIDFNGTSEYSNEVEVNVNIPKDYVLGQNYPNPFNPSTSISFGIPSNSEVSLKVYDLLGREVATLVDKYKSAGSYKIDFNAIGLPSGVYVYQLRAGSFNATKKMILLK
jgi:hypothetical protein